MTPVIFWVLSTAQALTIEGKPRVVFHAEGSPGFLTFEGVTRTLTLVDSEESLIFGVPMDTVETGIALRDQHLRETYVQTDQFPNATLTLARADVVFPAAGTRHEGELTGHFTAHGVDREVEVSYRIRERKGRFEVDATFPFDTSAHGIAIPAYLGVTIQPAMLAEVSVTLAP